MTTAWVFPGQGSQYIGMARDLYETYDRARAVIDAADAALGAPLSRLMFEGPEAELTDTVNAQPALLAHSIATLAALEQAGGTAGFAPPIVCAGHSLGEYAALVAAGSLDLTDGIRLVRARGDAMKRAGLERPGAMAAVLGLDETRLREICAQAGAVQIANFNAPGQVVISGEKSALERALEEAKKQGAKRAVVLAVSIAAHSELMRPAVEWFRPAVMMTPLQMPRIPVVSNVTATLLADTGAMREEMLAQLTSAVLWTRSVQEMRDMGVDEFLEIGPKDVLTGLNKRIVPTAQAHALGSVQGLEKYLGSAQPKPLPEPAHD